jgi:hypothetical protein
MLSLPAGARTVRVFVTAEQGTASVATIRSSCCLSCELRKHLQGTQLILHFMLCVCLQQHPREYALVHSFVFQSFQLY